ncbi:hypothetical protein [Castellaniella caeni]|uniref:hypothetical protein n=1 Tax=Castellaniella caeni TaxID=266123 RepID=UPI00083400C3|nr:hypothetical protein [Castellaniella caeni]
MTAWKAWKARLRSGVTAQELTEAVARYAAHCRFKGKVGTEHTMMGSTFFGPNERWKERYEIPSTTEDGGDDDAGSWWLAAGFSARWEAENEGCSEGKAWMFEGGKQVRQPEDWQAYKAGRAGEGQP